MKYIPNMAQRLRDKVLFLTQTDAPECFLFGVQKSGGATPDDAFDDVVGIVVNDNCYVFRGTTNPGQYWILHPEELGNKGAAFLDFGWHKDLWEIGVFKRSVPRLKHTAFISRRLADVHRDIDKNGHIDAADIEAKAEGICCHGMWNMPRVDRGSAGCVGPQKMDDIQMLINIAETSGQKTFSFLHLREDELPDIFKFI